VTKQLSGREHLQKRMLELERLQENQLFELKQSAISIVDSVSPVNMVKNALKNISASPDLRNSAINTAIGIGAGFLGKKLYVGNSKSIFKKVAGSAMQFLIANFVRNKIPEIKEHKLQHNHEEA
jgi:hypothetical protein